MAEQENKAYQETYKYLMTRHIDRKDAYIDSMKSAYSLIVNEYCTNAIVTSLKQMPTFKSKIKNDPINLLKAIGEAIHIPVVNQYHFETLINALLRWMTDKQQKDESIDDYLARNRHYASIVEGMLGNDFLSTFIQNTSEYKSCLLYTSPSPRDLSTSRMPSSA